MNVHIIKDSKLSQNIYDEVIEILQDFNKPLIFIRPKENNTINLQFETITTSPQNILKICDNFRIENDIGDRDFVILLTEQKNEENWFSKGDDNKNAFIHTSDWGYYLECNSAYPITYEIVANIYYMILFKGSSDLYKHIHKESRGCINDFCQEKKDITLKMRTADICPACQNVMIERDFPMTIATQMFKIMEFLRKNLLSLERLYRIKGASRVEFRGHMKNMFLVDLNHLEIRLTPLEKSVYHLFINHPEGILPNSILDVKEELRTLYGNFYNGTNVAQFNNSIEDLCNYMNSSMQEKVSSIKRKIIDAVGSRLAEYYIITRDNDNRYKIY